MKHISVCMRKIRYENRTLAKKAVIYMDKKHKKFNFSIYKCEFCDGWHLTKQIIREKRPRCVPEISMQLEEMA